MKLKNPSMVSLLFPAVFFWATLPASAQDALEPQPFDTRPYDSHAADIRSDTENGFEKFNNSYAILASFSAITDIQFETFLEEYNSFKDSAEAAVESVSELGTAMYDAVVAQQAEAPVSNIDQVNASLTAMDEVTKDIQFDLNAALENRWDIESIERLKTLKPEESRPGDKFQQKALDKANQILAGSIRPEQFQRISEQFQNILEQARTDPAKASAEAGRFFDGLEQSGVCDADIGALKNLVGGAITSRKYTFGASPGLQGRTAGAGSLKASPVPGLVGAGSGMPDSSQPAIDKIISDKDGYKYKRWPGVDYKKIKGDLYKKTKKDSTEIHPNDIDQGNIGDCYLMASMAEIAQENPDVIRNMIKENPDGTYSVTFHQRTEDGMKAETVTVDNQFPVYAEKRKWWEIWKPQVENRPAFAQFGDTVRGTPEIWPLVLEKGYAKWQGSYNKIEGGYSGIAMEAITGVRSTSYRTSDVSVGHLAKWDGKDYAMVISTKLPPEDEDADFGDPLYDKGILVPQHAYWIEEVDTVNKTVTIRNPWGWDEDPITLTEKEFQNSLRYVSCNPIR